MGVVVNPPQQGEPSYELFEKVVLCLLSVVCHTTAAKCLVVYTSFNNVCCT